MFNPLIDILDEATMRPHFAILTFLLPLAYIQEPLKSFGRKHMSGVVKIDSSINNTSFSSL